MYCARTAVLGMILSLKDETKTGRQHNDYMRKIQNYPFLVHSISRELDIDGHTLWLFIPIYA
jgi:hypothetical protein